MSDVDPVTAFYGRWAGLYDVIANYTPGIGTARSSVVDALDLSPGDTVVEMGCGTGANLPYLRDRVGADGRVIGLDITPGMLSRAQTLVDREGWDNVHLVRADARNPPICRDLDGVLGTFVVGMFDDPGAVIESWCALTHGRVALLDAVPSDRRGVRRLNALFRVAVVLSTPPTYRFRYAESPVDRLIRRVEAAQSCLVDHASRVDRREFGLGFLRVTAGLIQ